MTPHDAIPTHPPTPRATPAPPSRPATAPRTASTGDRVIASVVAAVCAALLLTAFFLSPSAEGHGTHTQLGLPSCGWVIATGRPCATCGMTTSFAYASRGDLAGAFAAQPFGALLAVATATGFWIALHAALTGSRLAGTLCTGILQARVLWWLAGAAGAAWAYKLLVTPV